MNWLWRSQTNGKVETVKRVRKYFKKSDITNYINKHNTICFLCEKQLETPYKTKGGDNFTIHYEVDHWDDNRGNNNSDNFMEVDVIEEPAEAVTSPSKNE